jgi:hypothetical protein
VLNYFISPDNLRPKLLPALLENPSVPESELAKLALGALRETAEVILNSTRAKSLPAVVEALRANPYLKKVEIEALRQAADQPAVPAAPAAQPEAAPAAAPEVAIPPVTEAVEVATASDPPGSPEEEEVVSTYLKENATEIAAEANKPFQAIGGIVELLGPDYFPVTQQQDAPAPVPADSATAAAPTPAAHRKPPAHAEPERKNTLQKINSLDVKGRIQLALKGNKEERSILIRDGTKVVALAVLEAPKLSDGEVEKFASQKNVLEAVLRQIPLKRRFMKNYIVVRNLVANPRTPLDLGLGLMKNLLIQDLKNISANKEISETIRKLALKMYKQKLEAAAKK